MGRIGTQAHLFDRGSNVADYWLAHAEGFEVASARTLSEHVDSVVVDATGRAKALIVRAPLCHPRLVPAAACIAVDPFERVLVLDPKSEQPSAFDGKEEISKLVAAIVWMRLALPPLLRFVAARIASVAQLQPHLKSAVVFACRCVRTGGAKTRAAVIWLRPHVGSGTVSAYAGAIAACTLAADAGRHGSATVASLVRTNAERRRTRARPRVRRQVPLR